MPSQNTALSKSKKKSLSVNKAGNPMNELGPAMDQLPKRFPVFKLEYLADPQTLKDHPDWQAGKFSCSLGEQLDSMIVCLLGMKFYRICWPPNFDAKNIDREPLCKSDDGLFPSGGSKSPLTDVKAKIDKIDMPVCVHFSPDGNPSRDENGRYIPACPYANWGANNEPPQCKEVFGLLVYEHTLNLPGLLAVKATGIKHLSSLFGQFELFKKQVKDKKGIPIKARAKVEIVSVSKGRWFEPVFRIIGLFSDVETQINMDALDSYNIPFAQVEAEDFDSASGKESS